MNKYYLYILKCSDETLYTGITTDLKRRLKEHNSSNLGAKYTSGRRPVELVYQTKFNGRAQASQAEAHLKKLSRLKKLALITHGLRPK
ncbi:endonuclease [Candidatus Falkowbacteria bacterium CG10_big_fil_rev_8_21_14_0_10_39_9]|uniref:Endonuclease n=1 Tax=Candidatus Falkowbacteria bacterium CG10_big_fil_rev_8_21_14_0_10_39_9 TaxID=1974566 RepID=A0A2M6WNK6_9BACT|nr:MAG: endonuclease [Candidatus Falkowbacteria bacterium CG10_big_fil_rev_8_21_14_0_10_39_9]